ncbi:MAG: class I SAM-dependent methyltransferase [Candidatus Acidiferrales bacterium]
MLGIPVRYLLKHPMAMADLAADPVAILTNAQDIYTAQREQRGPQCRYEVDKNWERLLHEYLCVAWPCKVSAEFQRLWPAVMKELEAQGIRPGPMAFGSWNDGDAGLARAIWCLTRHLGPSKVVETGVAHGVTSRFVLEALEKNGSGHLSSIDLPPIEKDRQEQVGMAVGGRFPDRWTYLKGSSRRRLPSLLSQLGQIDLFIHDSLHSERNVRFEMDRAWSALRPGGAIIVDDVDANWGFRSFTQTFSGYESLICEAEPVRPDPRRFNEKGLFGIILKKPLAQVQS